MAWTPSVVPRCPLCGATMRENTGLVQRWWTCPSCLHRETTVEDEEEPNGRDKK